MNDTTKQIAETLLKQIGRGTLAMLGAGTLVALDETRTRRGGLQFSIKGCKRGNKLVIELDPSDTYNVQLYRLRNHGLDCKLIEEVPFVYVDSLHDTIKTLTGLEVRL
jgi:hypothetical protein